MVAAAMRTIYAQPDAAHVQAQFDEIVSMLARQFPDAATILTDARDDVLAFCAFPEAHWRKIWSTNPLERVNGEIKRRTRVGAPRHQGGHACNNRLLKPPQPDTQTFTRAGSYTTRGATALWRPMK
jgi:hypothetical protein